MPISPRAGSLAAALCLFSGVSLSGCADPGSVSDFGAADPAARLRAAQSAVRTGDRAAIPSLINMLASDDPA
ncbi:MAG: hypothetical protein K2Q20_00005, partial [Phycisphaerales bacterium]|nr:hypothetical protein [Phycisphaerales bacterium]